MHYVSTHKNATQERNDGATSFWKNNPFVNGDLKVHKFGAQLLTLWDLSNWNNLYFSLLFIFFSSFYFYKIVIVGCVYVGKKPMSVGKLLETPFAFSIAYPYVPQGIGWSEGFVHHIHNNNYYFFF